MLNETPVPMRWLGLAGLVPFWALAIASAVGPTAWRPWAATGILAYGATILSFLGGAHWGVAARDGGRASWGRLGWGVTPSLVAWAALLVRPDIGLAVLIFGLAAAFGVDRRLFGDAPGYRNLRAVLTSGAVGALLLSLAARRLAAA